MLNVEDSLATTNGHNDKPLPVVNGTEIKASEVEVAVLPLIRDLYRIIEHDRPDGNQRRKDSVEAGQKVADLAKKLEKLREDVYHLSGISTSKSDQLEKLKKLRKLLAMKKALIARYKDLPPKTFCVRTKITDEV